MNEHTRLIVKDAKKRLTDLLESGGYARNVVGHVVHNGYIVKIGKVKVVIDASEVISQELHDDDWKAFLTCLGDHTNDRQM